MRTWITMPTEPRRSAGRCGRGWPPGRGLRTCRRRRRTDFVQSLDRGLAVIRCFSSEHPSLTLSEVAERTGLTRAAARRFLLTLQELGYVGSSGRQFSLRPRVLALGYAYLSSFSVSQIAQPHLEDLAEQLHESCSVSVLDGDDLVYVARASANRIMTIALTVGTRLPAYPTSMGRILLAHLPERELDAYLRRTTMRKLTEHTITDPGELRKVLAEARSKGWAAVDQELEAGVRSIAVPHPGQLTEGRGGHQRERARGPGADADAGEAVPAPAPGGGAPDRLRTRRPHVHRGPQRPLARRPLRQWVAVLEYVFDNGLYSLA